VIGRDVPQAPGLAGCRSVSERQGAQVLDERLSPELVELAHAYGVATEFWDWLGRHTMVVRSTIEAVLAALDVEAATDAQVSRSLADARDRPWRLVLPDIVVARQGATPRIPVHVEHGQPVEVSITLEDDAGTVALAQEDRWVDPRVIDGRLTGEATFVVPAGLPLGYHRLHARW
jgi:4-alpha-glucanotransferase